MKVLMSNQRGNRGRPVRLRFRIEIECRYVRNLL
jgi:hypothetical protein